jgi:hypothetical protein
MASNRFHAAPDPERLHRMATECTRLGFELVPIDDALVAEAARMGYTIRRFDRLAPPQPTLAATAQPPQPAQAPPGHTPPRRWVGDLPTGDLQSPRATTASAGQRRLDLDSDDDAVDGAELV